MKKVLAILAILALAFFALPGAALAEPEADTATPIPEPCNVGSAPDGTETAAATTTAIDPSTPKQEVVYGILGLDGSVESIYVVNIFESGNVVDYGNYTNLQNLTSEDPVQQDGDRVSIQSAAEKIYYQGSLKTTELPWNIQIRYTLNGKSVKAENLAGKTGKLGITINIDSNGKVNETFFLNYALQVGVTLDTALCSNIASENATFAEAGRSKQLTYTILPGKSTDITITADVRDFEMAPITLNGVRMSMTFDINMEEFTDQFDQLIYATGQIDDGANGLLGGSDQLSSGMNAFADGFRQYNDGMAQLAGGVHQIVTGTGNGDALSDLTGGGNGLVAGMAALRDSTFAAYSAQFGTQLTPDNFLAVLQPMAGIPGVPEAIASLSGIVQLTNGLAGYVGGVNQLADGIVQLDGNVQYLAQSSAQLAGSATQLAGGVAGLRDGLAQFRVGTQTFRNRTASMDTDIKSMTDDILSDIMGNGDPTVSFVSEKNSEVSLVQFVLKTDAIELPKAETAESQPAEELTFWEKLVNLFKV